MMAESPEYKALLECFDSLVTALKFDPASLADELAAKGLVPPGDVTNQRTYTEQARELAGRILDRVKLAPSRYHDVIKILSRHLWMEDFVRILEAAYKIINDSYTVAAHADAPVDITDGSKKGCSEYQNETTCEFSCDLGKIPRCKPSFEVANPVVQFNDLEEDDLEDLFAKIDELTKKIKLEFGKFFDKVFVSFRDSHEVDLDRLVLTLINDEKLFKEDELAGTRSVYDVFKAIRPYCSYFNYDVLEMLVKINGSPQAKGYLKMYLQAFSAYCKAMPCVEKLCGSEDTNLKRAKLKFKLDFDRQQLKPDAVRTIKCKIADHLGVRPSALYLCRIEEGCISLTFLVPTFITGLLFSLSDAQKIALHEDVKTLSIECKFETLHLVQDIKFEVKCLQEATRAKEGEKVESKEASWNDAEPLRNEVRSPRKVFDWFRRFTISRSSGSSNNVHHLHSDTKTTLSTEIAASWPHAAENFEVQKRKGHLGWAIKQIFLKMRKKTRRSVDLKATIEEINQRGEKEAKQNEELLRQTAEKLKEQERKAKEREEEEEKKKEIEKKAAEATTATTKAEGDSSKPSSSDDGGRKSKETAVSEDSKATESSSDPTPALTETSEYEPLTEKKQSGTDSGYSSQQPSKTPSRVQPVYDTPFSQSVPYEIEHMPSPWESLLVEAVHNKMVRAYSEAVNLRVVKEKVMEDSTDTSDDEGIEEILPDQDEMQNNMESANETSEACCQQIFNTSSSTVPSSVNVSNPSKLSDTLPLSTRSNSQDAS